MLSTIRSKTLQSQRGVLTLVISLVILSLSTLVTINLSRAILMEQRIANNDTRARQAFEAAEAGINAALIYLGNDPDVDLNGIIDPVFDTNADGIGDSISADVGTGSVTVTTVDLSGDMTSVRIRSQGFSDDRSATRTITQTLVTINPLPNMPDNPLVTRGGIIISGSATVHNPEGHSTIWSGGDIDLGSNNSTSTEVPDIGDPGYPACMDIPMTCNLVSASNRLIAGVDIIENDSSLGALSSDELFQNFFGVSPAAYRASMVTIDTTPAAATAAAHLATHEVIWIDGNANLSNITVGCRVAVTGNNVCSAANTKPSIVIVNGNATFGGTPHFYGLLFVRGNVTGTGNTTVHGAMVIGGTSNSSTGGSLDIWYSSSVLRGVARAGATTGSAGTWQDF
ncbi:MAG: pilus assembly PilX N-terminal domain-containing protein [Gammaproteobacteria bacterium]|nr:pilus assembly PilX N-terminal domain-containing protein [Gammaproteobacteria bacterium]MDP2139482.1 pilus assembly PilX N-terminal domain-containing protein [Gammaproteobacteria bacterium]MDP2346319.1 pilus assembly PilX N-terminal domain-containing protein [Gammaproteobacteria bacterium]